MATRPRLGEISSPSGGSFRVLDPSHREQLREWVELWSSTSHREVQAHPCYGMTFTPDSDRFLGALAVTEGGSVILPFSVGEVPVRLDYPALDAVTPYGYGGAYLDGNVGPIWFWDQWDRWAQENGLVGITIRSHPFDDEILPVNGASIHPLDTVVVDLGQSMDEIWTGYKGSVRTDIRRGRRLGVSVTCDRRCTGLEVFHRLYVETMRQKEAEPFYLFDLDDLKRFVTALNGGVVLFHAHVEGSLVASEMQLVGARNAYYFLSACNKEGYSARANPVMKHEVIRWMKSMGLRRYVLGGGLTRDDSLFKYKRAYSPHDVRRFTVRFHESHPGAVAEMVAARMRHEPGWKPVVGSLPTYRTRARREAGPL